MPSSNTVGLKRFSALKEGLPAVRSPVAGLLRFQHFLWEGLAGILLQLKNAA